jgi:hypothetical protein
VVQQRAGLQFTAEIGTECGETLGICRKLKGMSYIFLFVCRDPFGMTHRLQKAGADTGHMTVAKQRDDWHPHPESLAGGRCAVVWGGIERDINVQVARQVCSRVGCAFEENQIVAAYSTLRENCSIVLTDSRISKASPFEA